MFGHKLFQPLEIDQIGRIKKDIQEEDKEASNATAALSLDQILTSQLDEPNQKSRVYKVEYAQQIDKNNQQIDIKLSTQKFVQIRVKSIEFMDTKAIAIYFYDVTHNIESFKEMKSKVEDIKSTNSNTSVQPDGYRMQKIMAHEFRSGLSMALMFLQNLMQLNNLPEEANRLIIFTISQINFLISHVSDTVDMRMIEEGKFCVVKEIFKLADTLDFIRAMFIP